MKERPILFSGAMVRAILDGRKTQTRRVVKDDAWRDFGDTDLDGRLVSSWAIDYSRCPYGQVGDRLYVREAWKVVRDGGTPDAENDTDCTIEYVADGAQQTFSTGKTLYPASDRIRPSIHMPRWASRIVLEITKIRDERLHRLNAEDARAEGIEVPRCGCEVCATSSAICPADASEYVLAFAALWDSIHGAGDWESNPIVWVVEFRRVRP